MDKKVAVEDLYVGSIIVHHVGDEVSAEDAEKWGWTEKVVGARTKAAKEAQTDAEPDRAVGAAVAAEDPNAPGAAKRAQDKTNGASPTR